MIDIEKKIKSYVKEIYKNNNQISYIVEQIILLVNDQTLDLSKKETGSQKWTQKNSFLITYADSIIEDGQKPLFVLNKFCGIGRSSTQRAGRADFKNHCF